MKHEKGGKRVRTIKKHIARDYEWKYVIQSRKKDMPSYRQTLIHIDGIPVLSDIRHVYGILLTDTKEELAHYLLDNDPGLRKFAELRCGELV